VPEQPDPAGDRIDPTSARRAIGATVGFGIVALTWNANGFSASGRQWAAAVTILLGVVLVDAVPAVRRALPWPGAAPATLVATLVAAALCVPETDQFPVAAVLPVSLLIAELASRRQLGVEWYGPATVAVLWAAVFGATGRQSALVGAVFAWWPVVLPVIAVTLAHHVSGGRRTDVPAAAAQLSRPAIDEITARDRVFAGIAAVVGAIAAWSVSRTGALSDSGGPAVAAVVVASGSSAIVLWVATRLVSTPADGGHVPS
jgi:hypothetical protein